MNRAEQDLMTARRNAIRFVLIGSGWSIKSESVIYDERGYELNAEKNGKLVTYREFET
jgi:hypothetical protein